MRDRAAYLRTLGRASLATLVSALVAAGCAAVHDVSTEAASEGAGDPPRILDGQYLMGTVLEIELRGIDSDAARVLLDALYAEVAQQERVLSRFDPQSELSRVNASAGSGPVAVDPMLAELLVRAKDLGSITHGTFDVTVGPLVELWSAAGRSGVLPDAAALQHARDRVGVQRIHVQRSPAQVALAAGTSLDLGGIAKGFALDRIVPRIASAGVSAALVSFGQSSVHAIGAPPGQRGWRILLRDPDVGTAGVITLRDRALSVSVSTGQTVTIGGVAYGHILDPRSGMPVRQQRLAAVVASSGVRAEALSKALLLLTSQEADSVLAALPDCAAMRLDADGTRWFSAAWHDATEFEETSPSQAISPSVPDSSVPPRRGAE